MLLTKCRIIPHVPYPGGLVGDSVLPLWRQYVVWQLYALPAWRTTLLQEEFVVDRISPPTSEDLLCFLSLSHGILNMVESLSWDLGKHENEEFGTAVAKMLEDESKVLRARFACQTILEEGEMKPFALFS